jgi:hypothetical protein
LLFVKDLALGIIGSHYFHENQSFYKQLGEIAISTISMVFVHTALFCEPTHQPSIFRAYQEIISSTRHYINIYYQKVIQTIFKSVTKLLEEPGESNFAWYAKISLVFLL